MIYASPENPQGWSVVAHKSGKWVPLTPEIFPISGTREEALERIRLKAGSSRRFRKGFDGWWLHAVRFDDGVRISNEVSGMRSFL